ncbi:hypothetical protein A4A49_25934 [Nicotiana attenuata]|uniref:Uncharacterized protein n=1 Tax=Nicotiana attenuata TaxID=49451 RepID=A0A1J6I0F7_NICAT|nr:hypothetical protein A4A49_25934 [Nicotiana attenuata]
MTHSATAQNQRCYTNGSLIDGKFALVSKLHQSLITDSCFSFPQEKKLRESMWVNGIGAEDDCHWSGGHRWPVQILQARGQNSDGSKHSASRFMLGHWILLKLLVNFVVALLGLMKIQNISIIFWARICIRNTEAKTPGKINLDIGEWKFEISLVDEVSATPRFAGKFDQSCSSGAFPVAANVETSYPAVPLSGHKHVGGQEEKPHFNSKDL